MFLRAIFFLLLVSAGFCNCTTFSNFTLEEMVGQLLLVHFRGEEVNEEAVQLIQEVKVGGILYYNWANGLYSPEQVAHLSRSLQTLAMQNAHSLPLFIAIDQEGGC